MRPIDNVYLLGYLAFMATALIIATVVFGIR